MEHGDDRDEQACPRQRQQGGVLGAGAALPGVKGVRDRRVGRAGVAGWPAGEAFSVCRHACRH